jgi:hypothetical protein
MSIDNTKDIIDSREIIERIEELEATKQSYFDAVEEAKAAYEYHDSENTKETPEWSDLVEAEKALADWCTSDEAEELEALEALAEECEQYSSDWIHGETLIRRSYWVEHVQDLLADCGDIPRDIPHYIEIDWEATARNIEADYASVDFDGVEYLIRSC